MSHQFLLLAQRSPFRDMGSGFRDRREHFDLLELVPWLLVLAAVLAALVVLSRYLNGKDNRRLYNNPRALFRALCRAHELTRADERLLWQLARLLEMEQPAELFLDPERFAEASQEPEFRRHQEALEALAARLFASEAPLTKALPPRTAAQATTGSAERAESAANDAAGQEPSAGITAAEADATPRLSEQHAVRALEALMKQIQVSRESHPHPPIETPLTAVETPV